MDIPRRGAVSFGCLGAHARSATSLAGVDRVVGATYWLRVVKYRNRAIRQRGHSEVADVLIVLGQG